MASNKVTQTWDALYSGECLNSKNGLDCPPLIAWKRAERLGLNVRTRQIRTKRVMCRSQDDPRNG